MRLADQRYRYGHCRAELGRGHVHRCPRSWLVTARAYARILGDENMVAACGIALDVWRSGRSTNPRQEEMRRLAKTR